MGYRGMTVGATPLLPYHMEAPSFTLERSAAGGGETSLLIAQGESLAYVRDQLGHASIQLTVDTYGHLIPGANRGAVNRLDDATIRNPAATENDQGVTV